MASSPRHPSSANRLAAATTDTPGARLGRRHALQRGAAWVLWGSLGAELAACDKKAAPAAGPAATQASGTVSPAGGKVYAIGTDASYVPFESQDEKGDFIGFDIELLQAAARVGLDVEFINTPWEGLITALEQGDLDAAVSAIAITDERRNTLDFSTPYFVAQQLILVPAGSKVQRLQDLKGLRVGVQQGAVGDDIVTTALNGKAGSGIQRFDNIPSALAELEGRRLDAVVGDNGVLANYLVHNSAQNARLVNDAAFERESYAIAVKKGQSELLAKLNQGLAAMRADGSYAALHRRYFGELALPAAMAAPAASAPK